MSSSSIFSHSFWEALLPDALQPMPNHQAPIFPFTFNMPTSKTYPLQCIPILTPLRTSPLSSSGQLHQTQRKARQELTVQFGRPPNIQELSTRQNISVTKCRQIMRLCSQGLSLNRSDRVTGQELISQLRAEEDVGRDFRKPAVRFLLDDVVSTRLCRTDSECRVCEWCQVASCQDT